MSGFQDIYDIVAQIPYGKVMSYGQISRILNRRISAQLVGWAMRQAPSGLPCHRVIFSDGRLCNDEVFGGKDIQKAMLEAEGIIFKDTYLVDMEQSQV